MATLGWQDQAHPCRRAGGTTARMSGENGDLLFAERACRGPSPSGAWDLGTGSSTSWSGTEPDDGGFRQDGLQQQWKHRGHHGLLQTTATTSSPNELAVAAIHALKAVSQTDPTNGYQQLVVSSSGTITTGTYAKRPRASGAEGMAGRAEHPQRWRGDRHVPKRLISWRIISCGTDEARGGVPEPSTQKPPKPHRLLAGR